MRDVLGLVRISEEETSLIGAADIGDTQMMVDDKARSRHSFKRNEVAPPMPEWAKPGVPIPRRANFKPLVIDDSEKK